MCLQRLVKVIFLTCFFCLIYLFGLLRRFQHCTGHITTSSWKGRGNQYIEFVRVLYCKLPTNGKQLYQLFTWDRARNRTLASEVGGESVTTKKLILWWLWSILFRGFFKLEPTSLRNYSAYATENLFYTIFNCQLPLNTRISLYSNMHAYSNIFFKYM